MTAITTGGNGNWSSTVNNAPWAGGVVPVEGDTVIIASGHTVTLNQNATVGSDPGFGGTAALAITGALTFDNAASRTLTLKGDLTINSGGSLTVGSSGTRYNSAYVATIILNYSASMSNGKYGIRVPYSTTSVFKAYGTSKTNNTYLTAQAASGQAVISVNDATGWANGDTIIVAGINTSGGASSNAEEKTISSISGLNITLNSNLSVTHPANSYIMNMTKNVILKSYNTTNGFFADTRFGTLANFVLDNVAIQYVSNPGTAITTAYGFAINSTTAGEPSTGNLQNCTFYKHVGSTSQGGMLQIAGYYGSGATVNQCSFYTGANSTTGLAFSYGYVSPAITNNVFIKMGNGISCVFGAGSISPTISGNSFSGCTPAIAMNITGNWALSSNKFDGNAACYTFAATGITADLSDTSSTYGAISANGYVMGFQSNAYPAVNFYSPTFGSSEVMYNAANPQSNLAAGGFIVFNNSTEGATSNIFRRAIATGTFLKDLTTQRNSVSSVRYDATYAGTSTYSFTFLAKNGIAYNLRGNMRYNAAYDDAAYTLPSVTVSGLGITPVVATATTAALGAWEAFSINVTQSSGADGLLTVTFSAQSATSTGSAYFDGIVAPPFVTAARFYGYEFEETLPYRTVDPHVVAAEATALAYTGIAIDWVTEKVTVTTAHTLQEVYDYCIAQSAAAANLTKEVPMNTTDGLNFTMETDWDIVITNVAVTATGQVLTLSGTGSYTITGASGDFTGILADATTTRVKINTTNIVAGSRIQLYDTTAASELVNTTVTGTTHSVAFVHTTDHAVRLRAMYVSGSAVAYEWYTANGTVDNNGLDFVAAQVANSTYAMNAIDGSTVTEFSVSGTTVRIYVDDPDNTTSAQRAYNWYQWYLFSSDGIKEQDGTYVLATDSTHYVFDNSMKIVNQDTANPLNITAANIVPTSGAATNIFDLTNGASIALNFNRVEGFSYGLAAADIRTAVGMASANLDTQLGVLPNLDATVSSRASQAVDVNRILDRIEYQRGHHTVVGSTFYVDGTGGSDTTGTGTRALPYKTISKALTACTSNKHDEILLLANSGGGPTTITEAATISVAKNYVQIRGPGRDVNVTVTAGSNKDVFSIIASGVELSGFRITTAGNASNGVTVSNAVDFVRLHRLWIESPHQDGIQFNVANRCEVSNCFIVASGRDGVRVSSGSGSGTYNQVVDSVIRDAVGSAVNLQGSDASECRIQRNTIRDNAVGVTIASGVLDTVITDNRMVNNTVSINDAGTRTLQAWNFLNTDTTGAIGALQNNVITAASVAADAVAEIKPTLLIDGEIIV